MKKYIAIILGIMPLLPAAQLVMNNNFYMVMNGGTQASPVSMVLTNPMPSGVTNNGSGWIVSENEFNYVQWNIGTNEGNYVVPFGYSDSAYLPVSCLISAAGTGNTGVIKFSTYHCPTWNNLLYRPSDVTNLADFGRADYSLDMVDRFWEVDAGTGYTTKPTVNLTFTYSRNNPSEIGRPNNIDESRLTAQRFNPSLNQWDDYLALLGTDVITGNTGAVSSGKLTPANFYRSWTLANDSGALGVNNPQAESSEIVIWPNPASQNLYIKFNQKTESDAVVSVVDVTGRELLTQNVHITYGMVLPIDVSEMPTGIYFVRISGTNFNFISRFVRQ